MLRYYYINKEWMVSGTAQHVYRVTASLSLVLFFMLMALRLMGEIPNSLLPMVRLLLLTGVLGTATTMVAMEYFLFGFDSSSATKKVFWFCVMLLPPLGPALYCFIVYLRSDVLKDYAKRVEGPSA
ncbi:MAG: hypothetical protein WAK89_06475 [Candidatus Sulfotelmatobacter sp.]